VSTEGSCPVTFEPDVGLWVISDPGTVRDVMLEPATFGAGNALTAYRTLTARSLRVLNRVGFALPPTLASNSGPSHRQIRACVARFVSPGRVDAMRDTIAALVRDRLRDLDAALVRDRRADLVELVAGQVPAIALLDLLGIDSMDLADLKRWSRASLELFWGTPDPDRQEVLAGEAAQFYAWLRRRVTAERRAPGEGLLAALIALGLDDEHICSTCYFLLIAGQETTSQLISTIYQNALGQPSVWRACSDPDVVTALVDATLVESSPVPTWRRVLDRPASVGGQELAADAEVLLRLTGIGGSPDLAFGVGVHRCLGARLARLEAHVVISETARAFPDLAVEAGDPPMIDLLSFRAPAEVWARRAG
jgi:cytochrome P450